MLDTIFHYGRLIKFSHSIFALPFALAAVALAFMKYPELVTMDKIVWIVVAMVSARSAAMGFNRYADRQIDKNNPRTKNREIPRGVISGNQTVIFVLISIAVFLYSAFRLNELAFYLSPIALAIILGYSLTKRFTHFSHLVLGAGLGLAPLGAWIAIIGKFEILPIFIALGVLFWVAGFDVIYSCQDFNFDKQEGMFSIPVWKGIQGALHIARIFHLSSLLFFIIAGYWGALNWIYFLGLLIVLLVMIYEHKVVNGEDLSRIDMAFFNLNGIISVSYFFIVLLTVWVN